MNQTKERLKNVLLVVLLCGAVFLTYSTWFYDNPMGGTQLASWTRPDSKTPGLELSTQGSGALTEMKPTRVAVHNGQTRYGWEYQRTETDELYELTRDFLIHTVTSAGKWAACPEEEWQNALRGPGVFYDYQGVVQLDFLARWLGVEKEILDQLCGRYLFVAMNPEKPSVRIYLKDPYRAAVVCADADYSTETWSKIIGVSAESQVLFAFESNDASCQKLIPETFVSQSVPIAQVIDGFNAFSLLSQEQKNQFLEGFGFHAFSANEYVEQDGSQIYVEDVRTIKIEPDGYITYLDPRPQEDAQGGLYVQSAAEIPTRMELLQTAQTFLSQLAGMVPGEARLYLRDMTFDQEKDRAEILFGWSINGVAVDRQTTGYSARVLIENGRITEGNFLMRSYAAAGQTISLLSQKLAAAAIPEGNRNCEMELRYTDSGQTQLNPDWYYKVLP